MMLFSKTFFVLYYFANTFTVHLQKDIWSAEESLNTEEYERAIYFPYGELISIPKCTSCGPHYFSLLLFSESKFYPISLSLSFPVFL